MTTNETMAERVNNEIFRYVPVTPNDKQLILNFIRSEISRAQSETLTDVEEYVEKLYAPNDGSLTEFGKGSNWSIGKILEFTETYAKEQGIDLSSNK